MMARIRTIKPEFPHSESMGRVSRDARLLFIQLWTICDDSGRARGNSRMLASLLFPYDDDAPELINQWLEELERENCVALYRVDGTTYVQICNWLNHQKIDKPSPSKIPDFDESSRILANPRERSSEDQGSRIKDQGEDQTLASSPEENPAPSLPAVAKATASKKSDDGSKESNREAWESYSLAYRVRYGVDPVRNAKVARNVQDFVKRVGAEEAPKIAAFFVSHNDPFYVRTGHDFGVLLKNAEKVRMEWATGRTVPSQSIQFKSVSDQRKDFLDALTGRGQQPEPLPFIDGESRHVA